MTTTTVSWFIIQVLDCTKENFEFHSNMWNNLICLTYHQLYFSNHSMCRTNRKIPIHCPGISLHVSIKCLAKIATPLFHSVFPHNLTVNIPWMIWWQCGLSSLRVLCCLIHQLLPHLISLLLKFFPIFIIGFIALQLHALFHLLLFHPFLHPRHGLGNHFFHHSMLMLLTSFWIASLTRIISSNDWNVYLCPNFNMTNQYDMTSNMSTRNSNLPLENKSSVITPKGITGHWLISSDGAYGVIWPSSARGWLRQIMLVWCKFVVWCACFGTT